MMSAEKKFLFTLSIFLAMLAFVCAFENKRGIILKCQGNPVSCYGKRSAAVASKTTQLDETDMVSTLSSEEEETMVDGENSQEVNYEKYLEKLMRSCKLGVSRSCSAMLRIMLMNSNNN